MESKHSLYYSIKNKEACQPTQLNVLVVGHDEDNVGPDVPAVSLDATPQTLSSGGDKGQAAWSPFQRQQDQPSHHQHGVWTGMGGWKMARGCKRSSQAMHSHSCYSCSCARIKNKRFNCITVINTSVQTVYFHIACDGLIRLNLPTQSKVTPKLLLANIKNLAFENIISLILSRLTCCLILFGVFHPLLLCHGRVSLCPAAEVSSTLLFQVRSIGCLLSKQPHPLSLPSQWQGTFNPSLKSLSSPWVKLDRRSVGRMGPHQRGEGAQEVERGFRYINPRATVVTHSLTQIHPSSSQTLTHTAASQLVMQLSSVSFSVCGWLEINSKLIHQ